MNTWEDLVTDEKDCEYRFEFLTLDCRDNNIDLDKESIRILEIGSGNGIFLNYLENQGFKNVQGIDIKPRHEKIFPNLKVTKGKIHDMPFEDNAFDIVVSNSVFDSWVYRGQPSKEMMSEIQRVLVPNGIYRGTECENEIKDYISGKVAVIINGSKLEKSLFLTI